MIIQKARAYLGPNLLAAEPLAHIAVLVEGPAYWPNSQAGAEAAETLLALLPGLAEHPGRDNQARGFAAELRSFPQLPLGYVAARIAVELQRSQGEAVMLAGTRRKGQGKVQDIFYRYHDPDIALLAGHLAIDLVLALLPPDARPQHRLPEAFEPEAALATFRRRAGAMALDQTARALVEEAERRDIPWFILNRNQRIVQLGQGRHLRRIRESVTDRTSAIAMWIQRDKAATSRVLGETHFPVAAQISVLNAETAVRAARQIGYPVVVKPQDSKKGLGITLNLSDDEAVAAAFDQARRHSAQVLVEKHIPGADHRALVVGGRMIAAARRIPAAVTGDGESSIAELVAKLNADPRRGEGFSKLMNRVELDEQAEGLLKGRGYDRESVPPAGEVVSLRRTANISTGGTAVDVTDKVHPENRWMLERAARVVGLDVVGIDFLTPDIGRSYREVGGAICEVNISPGLRPHQIAEGPPRDVVGPIVDLLFPDRHNGRIPIAAVTGTNGKTTTSRMLAHILRRAGAEIGAEVIGLVTTAGVHINDTPVAAGDYAGTIGARMLLRDPTVDAAVLETGRGGVLEAGLAVDWCDVGALLNVTADHIGVHGIDSLDEMAVLKGRVAEAARKLAVLNADDPRCLALADRLRPERVCLFSTESSTEALRAYRDAGGCTITLEEEATGPALVFCDATSRQVVVSVGQIPATWDGAAQHNLQNAMAAASLAYGLGISLARIGEALTSFANDHRCNPGRLNVYDEHPFKVVLDFAHNPEGVTMICDAVRPIEVSGRRICVLLGVGNRHGEHIDPTAGIIADQFDVFVCSRLKKVSEEREPLRGFPAPEIPKRLAAALLERGIDKENVLIVDLDTAAVDKGLELAKEGDLLVFMTGIADWCWPRIVGYGGGTAS